MKIEGKVTSPVAGEVAGDQKAIRTGNAPVPLRDQPAPESVDVQVSALAIQLRQIGTQLRTGDVVDAAKVAETKQAIAQGQFQIKPEVVADRLLEIARELVRENPTSKH